MVDHAVLKLRDLQPSAVQGRELKACTIMPSLHSMFLVVEEREGSHSCPLPSVQYVCIPLHMCESVSEEIVCGVVCSQYWLPVG